MSEDKFTLGNFGGLDDLDEVAGDVSTPSQSPPSHGGEDKKIIKHPTETAVARARFGSDIGSRQFAELELGKIVPNEFQPRRVFNAEKLQELADSIREHGIIQPLVVVPLGQDSFEIIVGERRFRAAKIAGLFTVPVFVVPKISSQTKLELALIENVQRADLNPIEEAKAYEQLREEFGMKVDDIARRVGKDSSTISNLMRLLRLPAQIQRALAEGEIAEGQARPLLSLKTQEEMLEMYQIVIKNDMKVRDIEAKVREIKKRKIKVGEMFTPDPFLQSLESILRSKLGTRVMVNRKARGGNIMIEFFSDEELSDIINKLT